MSLVFALIATATAVPTASSPALVPLNKAHPAVMNKIILPFETSPSNEFADIANLEAAFQTKFEKNVEKLDMKKTVSRIPWPSSYWPTYQDGINYRWNSSGLTPVEKYAKAFNLNAVNLADTISATSGVDSQTYLPKCTETDSGCEDGFCAIREGKKEGHCIPTWFGICHAWAPAAILEPEPMCAVTGPNGVVFEPFDLKGLMSQLYDGSNIGTVFSGMRYVFLVYSNSFLIDATWQILLVIHLVDTATRNVVTCLLAFSTLLPPI
jgi:hypothetical protein